MLHAHVHVIILRWCDFVVSSVTSPLPLPPLFPFYYSLLFLPATSCVTSFLSFPMLLPLYHFLLHLPAIFRVTYFMLLPVTSLMSRPLSYPFCYFPSVTSYYFPCHIVCYIPLPFPVTSSATSCVTSPPTLPMLLPLSFPVTSPATSCFFPVISGYFPLPISVLPPLYYAPIFSYSQ